MTGRALYRVPTADTRLNQPGPPPPPLLPAGGPLIVRDYMTGAAVQVGVVSNGPPCDKRAYTYFTDLRRYLVDIAAWAA